MRILALFCVAPLLTMLAACVTVSVEYPELDELPQVREDAALVYFFKVRSRHNKGGNIHVHDNCEYLGAVTEGSFFFAHVTPGLHYFSGLEIDVEAGKTYYLENISHESDANIFPHGPSLPVGLYYDYPRRVHVAKEGVAKLEKSEHMFVQVPPELAQLIVGELTYRIVKIEGKPNSRGKPNCGHKIFEPTDSTDESVNPPFGFIHENTDLATRPTQSWPESIENQVWEYFAHQSGLKLTNLLSVECSETFCEIVFTGTEVNPKYVDEYSDLVSGMYQQPWNVRRASIGQREISPGAKAFIITISNQEYDQSKKQPTEETKEASLDEQ